MTPTADPDVNQLLDRLIAGLQAILNGKLINITLYGSLVTGDYDPRVSDVDLLVVLAADLTDAEFAALDHLHADLAAAQPDFRDRIEIAYVTAAALRTFKTQIHPLAVISPGEPFHDKDAGIDWLLNWYIVREYGVTLDGADATSLIDPIAKAEFLQAVRDHVCGWRDYLNDVTDRPGQSYAILTMCRALYTLAHGEHPSKIKAAAWAAEQMPEWAALIDNALAWRLAFRDETVDPSVTLAETRRFVYHVIDQLCP